MCHFNTGIQDIAVIVLLSLEKNTHFYFEAVPYPTQTNSTTYMYLWLQGGGGGALVFKGRYDSCIKTLKIYRKQVMDLVLKYVLQSI